jgi:hypothetical protein
MGCDVFDMTCPGAAQHTRPAMPRSSLGEAPRYTVLHELVSVDVRRDI